MNKEKHPECPNGHRRSRRVKAGDWKGHRMCTRCGARFNRDGTR
jgi:hypothetical protein